MPVTMPPEEMVPTLAFTLLHVPPVVTSVRLTVDPTHTEAPAGEMADGNATTVTTAVTVPVEPTV